MTIFNTDLATIGLCFEGDRLTRLAYLLTKQCQAPLSVHTKRIQSTIEKYLMRSLIR